MVTLQDFINAPLKFEHTCTEGKVTKEGGVREKQGEIP